MKTNLWIRGYYKKNVNLNRIKEFHLFVEGNDNDYLLLTYNKTNLTINKRYPNLVSVLFTNDSVDDSFKPKNIHLDISKKEFEEIMGIKITMLYIFFEKHKYFIIYDKYKKVI